MKKIILTLLIISALVSGCSSDSDVASRNIAKEAEMFRITRRIVFYDAIQGAYLLSIEGLCSIESRSSRLEVTCKTGHTDFKKHFLGISDNVTYFAEQLESAEIDVYHYKVIFKPKSIIPNVELSN